MSARGELKLSELKVADLKAELDKRGLDKTGVKSVLIERLRNALEDEGIDPDDHEFEHNVDSVSKSAKRRSDVCDDEDMETIEGKESDKSLNLDRDDEDTPCSDEEMDEYGKHLDDTESARFKNTSQSRSESHDENDDMDATSETAKADPVEEDNNNEGLNTSSETSETNDAKGSKSKVLKVIGKDKVQQVALTARTLWVTGLASTSKVSDLKNLFSKHGKVTSAKIVRSTKGTQRKWYGLLTMATSKDATKCIQKLHRTEFGGHVISVERRQSAPIVKKSEAATTKKPGSKIEGKEANGKPEDIKKSDDEDKHSEGGDEKSKSEDERDSPERSYRSYEGRSSFRGRFRGSMYRGRSSFSFRGRGTSSFRGRGRFPGFRRPFSRPSPYDRNSNYRGFGRGNFRYDMSRRPRDSLSPRDFFHERDSRMRDRAEEEMFRHKIIVRKQKEEAYRLEREKNQLRMEREMLEREKAEMLKMERAKQRMEREQLEMEREKLRRQSQMSHTMKRPFNRRGGGPPPPWVEKRREMSSSYEGPPAGFRESKFPYGRDPSGYKKPDFAPHDTFRREKMDAPSPRPSFSDREERREVTYHGGPERRVYSRNDFRGPQPGPSSSPREGFVPRSKPREEWKFHERRSGDKPPYPSRGRKMGYY